MTGLSLTGEIYSFLAGMHNDYPHDGYVRFSDLELGLFKAMVRDMESRDQLSPDNRPTVFDQLGGTWQVFGRVVCHADGTPYMDPDVVARTSERS